MNRISKEDLAKIAAIIGTIASILGSLKALISMDPLFGWIALAFVVAGLLWYLIQGQRSVWIVSLLVVLALVSLGAAWWVGPVTIEVVTHIDENRNGIRDEFEQAGPAGIEVQLLDSEGVVRVAHTDSGGAVTFHGIPQGPYGILKVGPGIGGIASRVNRTALVAISPTPQPLADTLPSTLTETLTPIPQPLTDTPILTSTPIATPTNTLTLTPMAISTSTLTAAPTRPPTPTPTRRPIDPTEIAVEKVWTIPEHYLSRDYNIVLLHPSELDTIRRIFNITNLEQTLILYKPNVLQSDGFIKELIGPFVVRNERNGLEIIALVTSTTPEYDPVIRDNSISMAPHLRQGLGLEVGRTEIDGADVRLKPAKEGLFSSQLVICPGEDLSTIAMEEVGVEEEEEDLSSPQPTSIAEQPTEILITPQPTPTTQMPEEEGEVRAITVNNPLPLELAPTVLAEQSATDLTLVRKISTHEHYWSGGNIGLFIQAMDAIGIEKAVFVPTGKGPDNRGYQQNMEELLEIQRRYPDRIIAFATVDEADPDASQILEQAVKEGAQGLKLIGGHPSFYDEPLNSDNTYRIIQKCEQFSLPVLIHVSTLDRPEMAAEFEDLLTTFPNVIFVAAHYGKFAPELDRMADMLDRFPNLYTDLSMGAGLPRYLVQIHEEPEEFRAFIIQYQDRILWGTDIILSREDNYELLRMRIESDLHLLSREVHVSPFLSSVIPLNGLNLPDSVLNKIFWENPQRILHIAVEP